MPFQQAQTYMTTVQTKAKRLTQYTLKISQNEYGTVGPKIREALKKIKQYYARYDLEYDYEIQALTPDNTLNIKA